MNVGNEKPTICLNAVLQRLTSSGYQLQREDIMAAFFNKFENLYNVFLKEGNLFFILIFILVIRNNVLLIYFCCLFLLLKECIGSCGRNVFMWMTTCDLVLVYVADPKLLGTKA